MQPGLVIRAQQGDHHAFATLASEAIGRLHTMARLILRDVERADDAVQDALLRAWLDIRGVRDPDRFEAWLTRLLLRLLPGRRSRTTPARHRTPSPRERRRLDDVAQGIGDGDTTWSPDGVRLAFDRVVVPANNLVQVVVFDPVTSTEVALDSPPLFGVSLVWAPDSTEIVAQLPADPDATFAWGWASHLVFLDPSGAAAPGLVEAEGIFGTQSWQPLAS